MQRAIFNRHELENCNACGFCQAACPIYRITRCEGSSARGHRYQLRALMDDNLKLDHKVTAAFDECLTCRACTAQCPTGIETERIVVEGRKRISKQRKTSLSRSIINSILPNPNLMRQSMRLLRLGDTAPAKSALSLLRRLTLLPQGMQRAAQMLPQAQGGFLHERLGKIGITPTANYNAAYFMSCGMNYLLPDAGESTLKVLRRLLGDVRILENLCCGLPAYVAGEVETARQMARKNISAFSNHKGPIITDCASCSSFLKKYPSLLGEEAEEFSARVQDFTEFSAARSASLAPAAAAARIVTYHDPCHLSRYQNLRDEPRQLLKNIKGLEYRELPEADWCCGGAGTYAIRHSGLSERILERKINNAKLTGADTLVTACPGCLLQLEYGLRKWKLPTKAVHISQLLAENL